VTEVKIGSAVSKPLIVPHRQLYCDFAISFPFMRDIGAADNMVFV